MKKYALIAFDLDDTLAPSKTLLPPEMVQVLTSLLEVCEVCVISGGQFGQFETQVLQPLDEAHARLERLHIMPTCGTRYCLYREGQWQDVYRRNLTEDERGEAMSVLEEEARRLGLWEEETWGEILEDRGSQVTFSALGQNAPVEAKQAWDPTREKKEVLRAAVAARLPDLEVRSGGSTSIDITRKGVDKGYGILELSKHTGIAIEDMLFVGDRLDEGGNDYPVVRTGIDTYAVANWRETVRFVKEYVARTCGGEG